MVLRSPTPLRQGQHGSEGRHLAGRFQKPLETVDLADARRVPPLQDVPTPPLPPKKTGSPAAEAEKDGPSAATSSREKKAARFRDFVQRRKEARRAKKSGWAAQDKTRR